MEPILLVRPSPRKGQEKGMEKVPRLQVGETFDIKTPFCSITVFSTLFSQTQVKSLLTACLQQMRGIVLGRVTPLVTFKMSECATLCGGT